MEQLTISPAVIYFMHIVDVLKGICSVVTVLGAIGAIVSILLFVSITKTEERKELSSKVQQLIILTFILFILTIFIPSKKVITKMTATKHTLACKDVGKTYYQPLKTKNLLYDLKGANR